MTEADRWRIAVNRVLDAQTVVLAEVDAKCPRTRYPLHRRLWWSVVGIPAEVRAAMRAESKERAELFATGLHARRQRMGGLS